MSVISVTLNPEAADAKDAVQDVLQGWLLANLESFDHTFAAVDLGAVADKDQFQWLNPTKLGYAIDNPEDAKVDDYVFGVLAMTEKRPGDRLGHQVSPNIIPAGCNAGFLIAQERFMTKIMLPGISQLFLKADASDFQVTADGSTITNINPVMFQKFTTANKDGTDQINIIGATLDANKFTLIADETTLQLSFVDLHFPWDVGSRLPGGYTVHMDYTATSALYMDANRHFHVPHGHQAEPGRHGDRVVGGEVGRSWSSTSSKGSRSPLRARPSAAPSGRRSRPPVRRSRKAGQRPPKGWKAPRRPCPSSRTSQPTTTSRTSTT